MKDMEKAPSINQSLGWQPHSAIESVLWAVLKIN